jgi:hypothetical protein
VEIKKVELNRVYLNPDAKLPYDLDVEDIAEVIEHVYDFLYNINCFLLSKNHSRLEHLLLGNALSGMISEIIVKSFDDVSDTLVRNKKVGGRPDLIPKNMYENDSILIGDEGIEVKCSKQPGGWQGHNPEEGWLMVFRFISDESNKEPLDMNPIEFVQILCAELNKEDWSFSGRKGESRRTITASITSSGMDKLRRNPIYQNPNYIVAPHKSKKINYDFNQKNL